ncbi:MAG: biotin/lipoyl-binding protein, partial [Ferruginibacter sp.]
MQYRPRQSSQLLFLFAILLFFSHCKSKPKEKNAPKGSQAVVVDVLIAEKEPVSNIVEANGTVIAGEYVELRPEVSGRLTYLNLAEGRPIAKGTVIARVNDADLRAQISRSKVQLDLAK